MAKDKEQAAHAAHVSTECMITEGQTPSVPAGERAYLICSRQFCAGSASHPKEEHKVPAHDLLHG